MRLANASVSRLATFPNNSPTSLGFFQNFLIIPGSPGSQYSRGAYVVKQKTIIKK